MWLLEHYLDQVDGHYHKVYMIACDRVNYVLCANYLAASVDLVRLMWITSVDRMLTYVPGFKNGASKVWAKVCWNAFLHVPSVVFVENLFRMASIQLVKC